MLIFCGNTLIWSLIEICFINDSHDRNIPIAFLSRGKSSESYFSLLPLGDTRFSSRKNYSIMSVRSSLLVSTAQIMTTYFVAKDALDWHLSIASSRWHSISETPIVSLPRNCVNNARNQTRHGKISPSMKRNNYHNYLAAAQYQAQILAYTRVAKNEESRVSADDGQETKVP